MSAAGAMAPAAPAALRGLVGALEGEGLRWMLLRPRESLAAAAGDADILVAPAELGRLEDLVVDRGFQVFPLPGPDLHAALYDAEAGRFVWIHAQPSLRLAGEEIAAEAVLTTANRDGVPQPGDAWLLWILLLRALVDKGELPDRHRAHVRELAGRWEGGPALLESLAHRRGLHPETVVSLAATGDWRGLLAHSVHRPAAPVSWATRIARVPRRLRGLRKLRARTGLSVAVVGPDGAGKTTLVRALATSLPLPVRIQYMGLTGGQLPRADALRVPGLILVARVVILWLRYARGVLHTARGGVVLFERYTLDGAVPSGVALSPAGKLSRRLQRRVCPMPDLVLLLDASGETMHTRSGEYDPAVLEGWRAAYARLPGSVEALEVIDAEQPADAVRRRAEALIWRRYGEIAAAAGRRRRR